MNEPRQVSELMEAEEAELWGKVRKELLRWLISTLAGLKSGNNVSEIKCVIVSIGIITKMITKHGGDMPVGERKGFTEARDQLRDILDKQKLLGGKDDGNDHAEEESEAGTGAGDGPENS